MGHLTSRSSRVVVVAVSASAALLFTTSCSRDEVKEAPAAAAAEAVEAKLTAAASSAPPPPAQASAAKPSGADPCPTLCARSRDLRCAKAETCADACREMLSEVACSDQLHVAMRCFAAQPVSHWECGDDGLAAVKDGHCHSEQARYVECIARATGQ